MRVCNGVSMLSLLLVSSVSGQDLKSALTKAVARGAAKEVRILLEQGADPNTTGRAKESVLLAAVRRDDLAVVELLVARGADVNAADSNGITPLMAAGWSLDPSRMAIGIVPAVNVVTSRAIDVDKEKVVVALLDKGARVDDQDRDGRSALMFAAALGAIEKMRLLIAKSAAIDAVSKTGVTPLMFAATFNQSEAVRLLLQQGVTTGGRDEKGKTAVDMAPKNSFVGALLQRAGQSPSATNLDVPAEWLHAQEPSKALVYVWRREMFKGGALKPSVFCDGVQIVRIQNGRWIALRLSPGRHVLRVDSPINVPYNLDLEANHVYFVRLDNPWFGPITMVSDDEGWFEIVHRRAVDAENIREPIVGSTQLPTHQQ